MKIIKFYKNFATYYFNNQIMKVVGHILEDIIIRNKIKIDNIHIRFMLSWSTVDAIFIIRQKYEKSFQQRETFVFC